jgi:chromosome segregation ATPase
MSQEKVELQTHLQDVQQKISKAAEDKENLDAQLQKLAAEKQSKETDLTNYSAQSQEFGKKLASVDIILAGFSEFIAYKENKN